MTARWSIECLSGRPELILDDDFVREAADEGFRFIDRLVVDWREGTNRFDAPGEILLGVLSDDGRTIAVGGLNRDVPQRLSVGRLRRVYVLRAFRGKGIASALVDRLEQHARLSFQTIRLRTDAVDAARFYEQRGYRPVDCETATHVLRLSE